MDVVQPLGRRWYVSGTRAGCGDLAVLHLERQKFEAFLPKVAEERLEGRKKRRVVRNLHLFPGYVFVRLDLDEDRWISVHGTVGCTRLLGATSDRMPSALPVGFVEDLQGLQSRGELTAVRADAVVHRYVKGQPVKIKTGSWEGHTGEFSRYRKGALVLIMTLFAREFELEFKPHEVAPASPQAA